MILPVPALFGTAADDAQVNPPTVGTVLGVLLLPLVLIFFNTGLDFLATAGVVDGSQTWVHVLRMLGAVPVALLISVIVALVVLGHRRGDRQRTGEDRRLLPRAGRLPVDGGLPVRAGRVRDLLAP